MKSVLALQHTIDNAGKLVATSSRELNVRCVALQWPGSDSARTTHMLMGAAKRHLKLAQHSLTMTRCKSQSTRRTFVPKPEPGMMRTWLL